MSQHNDDDDDDDNNNNNNNHLLDEWGVSLVSWRETEHPRSTAEQSRAEHLFIEGGGGGEEEEEEEEDKEEEEEQEGGGVLSDVTLADEGMYTCSLFTMPVRTAKAYLTVLEGDQITLTCITQGSKPAADLRWFRNEKEIKGGVVGWEGRGGGGGGGGGGVKVAENAKKREKNGRGD
ncbi:hypothetical protein CRUP_037548, partial [Coryphaenoides rupestris]